jgi:hypothetical protein
MGMFLWDDDTLPPSANADGWRASTICPPNWPHALATCGGTFFHTPPGLLVGAAAGAEVQYLTLGDPQAPRAIAALTLQRCRLSLRARHARLATPPAARDASDRFATTRALHDWLATTGVADVVMDSFAATHEPDACLAGERSDRVEFVIPIDGSVDVFASCSTHHRRCIVAGERHGWTLRLLAGAEAATALGHVMATASARARSRGDAFTPEPVSGALASTGSPHDAWGTLTAAAYAGGRLLSAALIGWGNHGAYYLCGGSTPEGYAAASAPWLHWATMQTLRSAGHTTYNLGGVAASARDATSPAHGLYRFKAAFGVRPVPRASVRWVLRSRHARTHAAARWVAARARA